MRLLLTGAGTDLGRRLAAALSRSHDVLATDAAPGPGVQVAADLRDPSAARTLLHGRDAVIHAAALEPHGRGGYALDDAARGTYNLLLGAVAAGVSRFVLLSTLRLLDRHPPGIAVETFRPLPAASPADLAPFLAEIAAREVTRVSPLTTVCLRLAEVVGEEGDGAAVSPRSVHVDDVLQAIGRALEYEPIAAWPGNTFEVYHVVAAGTASRYPLGAAGREPFGYSPRHEARGQWDNPHPSPLPEGEGAAPRPTASLSQMEYAAVLPPLPLGEAARRRVRAAAASAESAPLSHHSPRRVVVYGAGGPLGAAVAAELSADRVLRLTDVRSLAEIYAEGKAQSPGAPIAHPLGPPHEEALVDVGDEAQVVAAAEGMDAIVNCTVNRTDPAGAFRVNLVGAYDVCQAAVANGIARTVHTGPQQVTAYAIGLHGYARDFGVVDDVPARPGTNLYIMTKHLGLEVCRVFAAEYGLEIPALLFSSFVNPDYPAARPHDVYPMSVSWADAARAVRCALDVPFPRHLEAMHVLADLPHGQFTNEKAKLLLGWQPRVGLERQLGYD